RAPENRADLVIMETQDRLATQSAAGLAIVGIIDQTRGHYRRVDRGSVIIVYGRRIGPMPRILIDMAVNGNPVIGMVVAPVLSCQGSVVVAVPRRHIGIIGR